VAGLGLLPRLPARGWPRGVRYGVQRALGILLAGHVEGDTIRYSEMFPTLRPLELGVERTAEVLAEMGVLIDDRRPTFEDWLERKLDGLAPGIRRDVEAWARTLHDGGPRARARDPATVWNHLNCARPALLDWSARYGHLREVTHDDILAHLEALHGSARANALVALRSLFAFCRKHGLVFCDPARQIKVGERPQRLVQPLQPAEIAQAVAHVKTPAARLILAFAAVHAARSGAIRALRLEDVGLGDCRLVTADRIRPLDDLTRGVLRAWLDHRRARWPGTANPHLLVNTKTALETGPVSGRWVNKMLRGLPVTFERLRADRILKEALAHGRPDPLHLTAVFGLDDKSAIRYATAARELLECSAERYAAEGSAGTQGSTSAAGLNGPLGSR
jgi:integrase